MSSDSGQNVEAVDKHKFKGRGFLQRLNKRSTKVQGRSVGESDVRKAPGESVSLASGQPTIPSPEPQTTQTPSKPHFWRIRNIRSSEVDYAQQWVRKTSKFGCSLAKDGEGSYCATVTSVECVPPLDRAHWSVDKEFMGITPLCDCDDAEVDLVAVTGLGGHALGSFRSADGTFVWLRDALPSDVPQARILTYGYDTTPVKNQSKETIHDLAAAFLDRLDSFRRATGTERRPVCFLVHSLGGLVLKEALTISDGANKSRRDWMTNLDECGAALYTCALLLFGVPNLGYEHRQLFAAVKGQQNEDLIKSLVMNEDNEPSPYLAELTRKFSQLCAGQVPPFKVCSYFETERSPTIKASNTTFLITGSSADNATQEIGPGVFAMNGEPTMMVSDVSAERVDNTIRDATKHLPMSRTDHRKLVRFERFDHRYTDSVKDKIQGFVRTAPGIVKERLQSIKDHAIRSRLEKWLDPPDPTLNHRRSLKLRTPETGAWLLEGDKYNGWKVEMPSFLWLYGSAGSGKTVLSSGIINDLQAYCKDDSQRFLAYFYYDFNDSAKRDPVNMIKSLLYQFLEQGVRIPQSLQSAYASCSNMRRSVSLDQLLDALHETIRFCPASYIVLDALDECTARVELLDMLQRIHSWNVSTLHIVATSRQDVDIEGRMEKLTTIQGRICLKSDVVDPDIRTYVQTRLMHDEAFRRWHQASQGPAVLENIEITLTKKAHGMFRWAACQLDVLADCWTSRRVREALNNLPATLNDTYARIIEQIDQSGHGEDALKILRWLVYSAEPLTTGQVMEVTGICLGTRPHFDAEEKIIDIEGDHVEDEEDSKGTDDAEVGDDVDINDEQDMDDMEDLEDLEDLEDMDDGEGTRDEGNIEDEEVENNVDKDDGEAEDDDENEQDIEQEESATRQIVEREDGFQVERYPQRFHPQSYTAYVQLAHFSVREYLGSSHSPRPGLEKYSLENAQECHDILGRCCLVYLLQLETQGPLDEDYDTMFPLARYAASNWSRYHVRALKIISQQLRELMSRLLVGDSSAFAAWTRLDNPYWEPALSSLCAATSTGSNQVAQTALDSWSVDGDARMFECTDALELAVRHRYADIAEMLADTGADVNAPTESYGNLLMMAVATRNPHTVEVLIARGANVNAVARGVRDEWGRRTASNKCTALQVASSDRSATMVRILLDRGADVNAVVGKMGTALNGACLDGDKDVVEILLDRGADINLDGGKYGTPLQAASSGGRMAIVKILLNRGADVNAGGGSDGTALQAAAARGREDIFEVLIKHGANVNARSKTGSNALYAALLIGSRIIVTMLLDAGAEVNAQVEGDDFGTELNAACWRDYKDIVKILLDKGAKINATAGACGTALQIASSLAYSSLVQLLLDRGADVHVHGGEDGTALYLALYGVPWDKQHRILYSENIQDVIAGRCPS
ncbi:hypothetical protein LTR17_017691 [Elasticomyces elasticus]|nr:hypothetical protein LTR17_017691 [Elasticomyces elasticus]